MTRPLTVLAAITVCACSPAERGTLRPELAFTIDNASGLTGARDLTVDREGNVFVFSYDDYRIFKFDPTGVLLTTFGGTGEEPGLFQHLMAIRAIGDSLVALDAGSRSVFDLSGGLRSHHSFADTITSDLPRVYVDGHWAGEWIIEETAEQALTYRNPDGSERGRVASYALATHFPGLQAGQVFFINRTQAPGYVYDFLLDGRLVWMATDSLTVRVRQGGEDAVLFEAEATPVSFPDEETAALEQRQASLSPPLFMNVPRSYQVAHHLSVAASGDIWVYVMSVERTGLLRLSAEGQEVAFYDLDAGFDVLSARLTVAGDSMYFLVAGSEETAVYSVTVP